MGKDPMSMDGREFVELLHQNPVIAAVKDWDGLAKCLESECQVVFILFGTVLNIADTAARVKAAGKLAMIHVDLVDGLAARDVAVEFIATQTQADGIISTRQNLVRRAKALGLLCVQRFFVLDSMALVTIQRQHAAEATDAIEILPGALFKVIRKLCGEIGKPIIAGGLISDKEDIVGALDAGAVAISSTNQDVWFM